MSLKIGLDVGAAKIDQKCREEVSSCCCKLPAWSFSHKGVSKNFKFGCCEKEAKSMCLPPQS